MAYVYHCNAGAIPQGDFQTAIAAIGSPGPNHPHVYIAYAHQNASDPGYQQTIVQLQAWGIPANNVVEITNLFMGQFGMNNSLQIGY